MENERRKEMERQAANNHNINFIKTQMDERHRLKREWNNKDAYETRNLTDRAIQEFDDKEKLKTDYTNKLKGENLTALQRQIEDRRIRMSGEDNLNSNEANLNNYIGVSSLNQDKHRLQASVRDLRLWCAWTRYELRKKEAAEHARQEPRLHQEFVIQDAGGCSKWG